MNFEDLGGWQAKTVGALCTQITSGGTPARKHSHRFYADEGYLWVKTKELNDGLITDTEEHITEEGLKESSAKLLPSKTVLVAMYGATVGQLGILAREAACNQACAALIVDEAKADHRFLFYALLHHRPRLRSLASGSAQQNVSARLIRDFALPVPSSDEQRRIAHVLGTLDAQIDNEYQLATRAHDLGSRIYEHTFADCDRCPLSEIAGLKKGSVQPAATPNSTFEHFSIPAFDAGMAPRVELGREMLSGKTPLPDGDCILFSKLNPATRRVWWPIPSGDGTPVCSPEFVVLVAANVPSSFLYAAVRDDYRFQQEVQGRATGTTGSRQRIVPNDLLQCSVPSPSDAALEQWDSLTAPLYRRAQHALAMVQRLAAIRDALLPKLITGRLRVAEDYLAGLEDPVAV